MFTALLDIVLLPVAVVKDIVIRPLDYMSGVDNPGKSETRKQVEKIDADLEAE